MPHCRLTAVFAVLALFASAPVAAEPRPPAEGKAATNLRARAEAEREAKIRKAREEIRKNPEQKKFILFRYGLEEKDL